LSRSAEIGALAKNRKVGSTYVVRLETLKTEARGEGKIPIHREPAVSVRGITEYERVYQTAPMKPAVV